MPDPTLKNRYLYHGFRGMQKGADPRLLNPGELSNVVNMVVDSGGILRPVGAFTNHAAGSRTLTAVIPHYGLFQFSTDRNLAGAETGEDWLVLYDPANMNFDLYAFRTPGWTTPAGFSLGSTPNGKATFYVADGIVRVADANFGAANKPQWRGYIKRTNFPGTSSTQAIDGWFSKDAALAAPTGGAQADAPSDPTPSAGQMGLRIDTDTGGTWSGYYVFWYSFLYEGGQESLLFKLTGDQDLYATNKLKFQVFADPDFNERVIGARIYYAVVDDITPLIYGQDPTILLEVDFVKGVRQFGDKEWTAWGDAAAAGDVEAPDGDGIVIADPPSNDTYENLNGFPHDLDQISFENNGDGWKTAVVLNRSTYAGHVSMKDENGQQRVMADAIIKSPPGKFDTFAITNILQAAVRDGESIVKLETFADRILEFKERTLRIINASQELEFLEDTLVNKGIKNPGASIETDFGIAWVNPYGCFLYDGNQVINLLRSADPKRPRLLDDADWRSFITDDSQVGYASKTKQLFVQASAGSATPTGYAKTDCFMYDFLTGLWFHHITFFSADTTNFVKDPDGEMVYGVTDTTSVTIKEYDETIAVTVTSEWAFHEDDFGYPGVIKKCYEVLVVYRNNYGATPGNDFINALEYAVDGSSTFVKTNLTGTFLGAQNDFVIAKFSFSSPISFETIRFGIDPNANNKLEIKAVIPTIRVLPFKAAA